MAGRVRSPIFIVGPPRSGTTARYVALSRHRDVHVERQGEALAETWVFWGGLVEAFSNEAACVERGYATATPDEAARLQEWYDAHVPAGKRLLAKHPGAARIRFLLSVFPAARFIVCQRDPAAIAWSLYHRIMGPWADIYTPAVMARFRAMWPRRLREKWAQAEAAGSRGLLPEPNQERMGFACGHAEYWTERVAAEADAKDLWTVVDEHGQARTDTDPLPPFPPGGRLMYPVRLMVSWYDAMQRERHLEACRLLDAMSLDGTEAAAGGVYAAAEQWCRTDRHWRAEASAEEQALLGRVGQC